MMVVQSRNVILSSMVVWELLLFEEYEEVVMEVFGIVNINLIRLRFIFLTSTIK